MANGEHLGLQLDRLHSVTERYRCIPDEAALSALRRKRLARMERTYADLRERSRYAKAVHFLVNDLFGTEELGERGDELRQAQSAMVRMLPDAMLGTVARATEFTALTLELDLTVLEAVPDSDRGASIDDRLYYRMIRSSDERKQFERQIHLVCEIGREIEEVAHKPFVSTALKMCRRPAKKMGLSGLQDFLERGFDAFKRMKGSEEFLEIFRQREFELLEYIFGNK